MVTRNTEAAMAVLEESRAHLIAEARRIAGILIERHGFTHSRAVRHEMHRLGLLDGYDGADYWLGCVFRTPTFKFTGQWYSYSDPYRNVHERRVRIWSFDGKIRKGRARRKEVSERQMSLPLPALRKKSETKRAKRLKVSERQLALPGV